MGGSAAATAPGGTLDSVNKAEHLCSQKGHAHQNEKETPTSHFEFLLTQSNFCSICILHRTNVRVKGFCEKNQGSRPKNGGDPLENQDIRLFEQMFLFALKIL